MGKGFGSPVSNWMVSPLHTVTEDECIANVHRLLERESISAVPVVDAEGRAVGLISRTDLLKAGRPDDAGTVRALTFPDEPVKGHMHSTLETVDSQTPLAECARVMLKQHYHRLYITVDGKLSGVVSTREMMDAVTQGRVKPPISEIMTRSVVSVQAKEPLALALDRLEKAHKSALVVLDEGWPVGVFSQVEALACHGADPKAPVEDWMDLGVLCLPERLPCHRAAAQAVSVGVRRVIATEGDQVVGIVSGLDFARMVKTA